jgi:hypothetical protein
MRFLQQLATVKTLVDGSLVPTELSNVLTGLCDLVAQHQSEITELQHGLAAAVAQRTPR